VAEGAEAFVRLLHTADWHLGRTTYGEPRASDHDAVLAEILALARAERPDLILHSGDLFDAVRPAYPDLHRGVGALQELAAVAPVVVICGNHDSPALFRLFNRLLGERLPLRFVNPEATGVLKIPVGDQVARVAALPFVHANRAVPVWEDPAGWNRRYSERVAALLAGLGVALERGADPARDVPLLAAHLHTGGARFSGSERPIHVTDTYASDTRDLPRVAYAAFGHIHRPQALPGRVRGRYAGAPLPMDFGEVGEQKEVVLVDVQPGGPARVTPVPLRGGRPLVRLEGTLEELRELGPEVGPALALVTVHTATHVPELSERVRDLLPDVVVLEVTEQAAASRLTVVEAGADAAGPEPGVVETFREYLREEGTGGADADRVLRTFETLLAAVEQEEPAVFPEEAALS
jgi:DNA repair protein SbcD/Mre11